MGLTCMACGKSCAGACLVTDMAGPVYHHGRAYAGCPRATIHEAAPSCYEGRNT